jgi:ubiquitin fusion degradation protein 1
MYHPVSRQLIAIWQPQTFSGSGKTLKGTAPSAVSSSSTKGKAKEETPSSDTWGSGGHKLGQPVSYGAGGARIPQIPRRQGTKKEPERERSPTPDFGVDEDDIIDVDSD